MVPRLYYFKCSTRLTTRSCYTPSQFRSHSDSFWMLAVNVNKSENGRTKVVFCALRSTHDIRSTKWAPAVSNCDRSRRRERCPWELPGSAHGASAATTAMTSSPLQQCCGPYVTQGTFTAAFITNAQHDRTPLNDRYHFLAWPITSTIQLQLETSQPRFLPATSLRRYQPVPSPRPTSTPLQGIPFKVDTEVSFP